MTSAGKDLCNATVLVEPQPHDQRVLSELRADSRIEFIDRWDEQRDELRRLRPLPHPDVIAEPKRWAYYPWRRTVTAVLGPRAFRAVRLDRNRNLITTEEQDRLGLLRVGIVGLSVGHAIAYTLAQEGLCGHLRLADFDDLELSNLNRVPAGVFDHGLNKTTAAARRIAELDPYLPVEVFNRGVTAESVDGFLDGIDILVEECDSLDTKVLVRQAARERCVPVLMATGDRGLLGGIYLHWYGNGNPVTVSSKVAQAVKISARSKWEALAELERLGRIEVDRRPRKSPRAVLLHVQAKQT